MVLVMIGAWRCYLHGGQPFHILTIHGAVLLFSPVNDTSGMNTPVSGSLQVPSLEHAQSLYMNDLDHSLLGRGSANILTMFRTTKQFAENPEKQISYRSTGNNAGCTTGVG